MSELKKLLDRAKNFGDEEWASKALDIIDFEDDLEDVTKLELMEYVNKLSKEFGEDVSGAAMLKALLFKQQENDKSARNVFVHNDMSFKQRRRLMHQLGDQMVLQSRRRKKLWESFSSFAAKTSKQAAKLLPILLAA